MPKVPIRTAHRNGRLTVLPLLDHIDRARVRALPLPARRLVQLYGLTPATALTVACAAGFDCGGDRWTGAS